MKNIIDLLLFRNFDFINLFTYQIYHLTGPKEFRIKFSIQLGFDIFTIEPNFIIRDITFRFCVFIMVPLLGVLNILGFSL